MNVKERRVRKMRIAFIDILARSSYSFISISCIFYICVLVLIVIANHRYCYYHHCCCLLNYYCSHKHSQRTHINIHVCACVSVKPHARIFRRNHQSEMRFPRRRENTEWIYVFVHFEYAPAHVRRSNRVRISNSASSFLSHIYCVSLNYIISETRRAVLDV